eukprot:jgi/Ulvmu1/11766/UM008_0180.1
MLVQTEHILQLARATNGILAESNVSTSHLPNTTHHEQITLQPRQLLRNPEYLPTPRRAHHSLAITYSPPVMLTPHLAGSVLQAPSCRLQRRLAQAGTTPALKTPSYSRTHPAQLHSTFIWRAAANPRCLHNRLAPALARAAGQPQPPSACRSQPLTKASQNPHSSAAMARTRPCTPHSTALSSTAQHGAALATSGACHMLLSTPSLSTLACVLVTGHACMAKTAKILAAVPRTPAPHAEAASTWAGGRAQQPPTQHPPNSTAGQSQTACTDASLSERTPAKPSQALPTQVPASMRATAQHTAQGGPTSQTTNRLKRTISHGQGARRGLTPLMPHLQHTLPASLATAQTHSTHSMHQWARKHTHTHNSGLARSCGTAQRPCPTSTRRVGAVLTHYLSISTSLCYSHVQRRKTGACCESCAVTGPPQPAHLLS